MAKPSSTLAIFCSVRKRRPVQGGFLFRPCNLVRNGLILLQNPWVRGGRLWPHVREFHVVRGSRPVRRVLHWRTVSSQPFLPVGEPVSQARTNVAHSRRPTCLPKGRPQVLSRLAVDTWFPIAAWWAFLKSSDALGRLVRWNWKRDTGLWGGSDPAGDRQADRCVGARNELPARIHGIPFR